MVSKRELEALEDLWRIKLAEARARYEHAAAKCRALFHQVHHGTVPEPDDAHTLQTAHQEEEAALNECLRLVRQFTDFIVYGRMPSDEE